MLLKRTIYKGMHYSYWPGKIYWADKIDVLNTHWEVKFDENCLYEIEEKSCVNKLFGYSFGLFGVHEESIRIGWAAEGEEIVLYSYIYTKGKLHKKKIYTCKPGVAYQINLTLNNLGNKWDATIRITDPELQQTKMFWCEFEVMFKFLMSLGIYFGGNSRAPHTMNIYVNDHYVKK